MEMIKIESNYFGSDKTFLNYLKSLSFINIRNINSELNFIKNNNIQLFNNINKYRNFLIFGDVQSGKTNNLIYITQKLSIEYGYNFVLYLAGTKNDLMFQNQERFYKSFMAMDNDKYFIVNSKGSTKYDQSFIKRGITGNKVIIMHSIKRAKSLDQIFKSIKIFKKNIRILIIDDEADEASLSRRTKESIDNFSKFNHTKKISITASPFKNLYSNSKQYDYFYKLKSPDNYTGIEEFEKNNYVVLSSDNEKMSLNFIIKPLLEWMITIEENDLKKSQILFNIFNQTKLHDKISNYITKLLLKLTSVKWANKLFEDINISYDPVKIANFSNKLIDNVIISNSNYEKYTRKNYEVIIGGLKLSRGITYENLTFEVMINMGNKINASTLIQRARWLGYRKNILPLMRIYITDEIREAFEEVKDLLKWIQNYYLKDNDFKTQFRNREYERIEI